MKTFYYLILKRVLFFFLVIILICSCSSINKLYVPFSEAKQVHKFENDEVIRVYFDRMGFIYPDIKISNNDFIKNKGRLSNFYSDNLKTYQQICAKHNTKPLETYCCNIETYEDPLQTTLIKKYTELINKKSKNKELVFIIHGYNEYPLKASDISSFDEMKYTRQIISERNNNKEIQYVEIYWDGLSKEGGPKALQLTNSVKIWNNAQVSATYAGIELRRLLAGIDKDTIITITHSHGAGVITTALFNVIKFNPKYYDQNGHWLKTLKYKYQHNYYNTPKQQFVIGMLAPAIPGVNVFKEYFHRTESGKEVISKSRNYSFIIGFNENDPVTSKYKIAAKKLGSTSLGSVPQELLQTENLYNNRNMIDHVDFSTTCGGQPQNDHSWCAYLKNTTSINQFLIGVFM